jgi:hypothetical protein
MGRLAASSKARRWFSCTTRGRKSGVQHVAPLMYLADETDPETVYVFASRAGAATDRR